jgi:hypothetical protein
MIDGTKTTGENAVAMTKVTLNLQSDADTLEVHGTESATVELIRKMASLTSKYADRLAQGNNTHAQYRIILTSLRAVERAIGCDSLPGGGP